ncbi:hypothetical protein [Streptomyces cellostaticus]|uniref:hypothetical protein n=1 Tax=Streptomyces cellostaticus TaxID=67285 RepID=UPI00295F16E9|nr:hypothetical protein [Streptomyces cellostaticus]
MALASAAATTVVQLLATAGWEQARAAVGRLWRQVQPERADAVRAALEESRSRVLTARDGEDGQAERELVGEWEGRLAALLTAHPAVAAELRRLLADELAPALARTAQQGTTVTMTAVAKDSGRIYQAGRDQHITER